ncbi:hypothetical protein KKH23_08760 [Patescibacteria group bacterium]|nr:hypothetical protein [Patescibacteria group bacterium]
MSVKPGMPVTIYEPEGFDPNLRTWGEIVTPDTWRNDNQGAAQDQKVIWTPRTGRRILLVGVLMSTEVTRWFRWEVDGALLIPPVYLTARGGANLLFMNGLMLPVDGQLMYTSAGDGWHSVMAYGKEF